MIKNNLSPLKQPQCQQSCRREVQGPQSWPNSGKAKISRVAWKKDGSSGSDHRRPAAACSVESSLTYKWFSVSLSHHTLPLKCKSENRRTSLVKYGEGWGSWGRKQILPVLPPTPQQPQRDLCGTVWNHHTGVIATQVTYWMCLSIQALGLMECFL